MAQRPKINIKGAEGGLTVVIIIAAVVILYYVFKGTQSLLEKTNIIPDKEEREAKKTIEKETETAKTGIIEPVQGFTPVEITGGAWNREYYKALTRAAAKKAAEKGYKSGVLLSTTGTIKNAAQKIYDSVRTPLAVPNPLYWIDNPQQGLGQIKRLKTKAQVSQLTETFLTMYGKDLYFWLKDKYDTQDQKQALADIITYVNSLPSGGYIFPKNRSINEIKSR